MSRRIPATSLQFPWVELAGISYAIVPAATLLAICRRAGIAAAPLGTGMSPVLAPEQLDGAGLARRIADRRKNAGLTQGELARRAAVRVETVNRIERGHVTPDFGTIRKLLQAMAQAEAHALPHSSTRRKE